VSSDASPPRERDDRERSLLERIVPELVKKLVDVGFEKLADGPENIRQLLAEMKLPREAAVLLLAHLDETKRDIAGVLARELREFLERASLADELTRLLSGLTLEVKTQVRFVPNTSPTGRPRPEVKTKVGVHVESASSADETESVGDSSSPSAAPPRQPSSPPSSVEGAVAEQERSK
jgi:hypothetical protein